MDWFSGIVVFILTWWIVIFCVLPWGLQRDERGIPTNLNVKKKILYTTLAASIIWIVVYILVSADIVSFHNMALKMTREDHL